MTTNFKTRFWNLGKWYAVLFVVLFVFRLIYGYVATSNDNGGDYSDNFFQQEALHKYTVSHSKMLRYADRRNKKDPFDKFLKSITNLRQQ